jgi:hypothetical protein
LIAELFIKLEIGFSNMSNLEKATNELVQEQKQLPVSLAHKIALIEHKEPLVKNPEEGQKFLCKQVVYIYTALGHTNIFTQQGGKEAIQESAMIIFNNLESNYRLRHLSCLEVEQAIRKGCAGEFERDEKGNTIEFKHFSPTLVTSWLKMFNQKFTPQVIKEREKLNQIKLMEYRDKNEEQLVAMVQGVRDLFEYMEDEKTHFAFDRKLSFGRMIAKGIFGVYPFAERLVEQFSNRKDLWQKWKEKSRAGLSPKMRDFEKKVQEQTMKQYCYEIYDLFKAEFKGDEMMMDLMISTIEEYHDENK